MSLYRINGTLRTYKIQWADLVDPGRKSTNIQRLNKSEKISGFNNLVSFELSEPWYPSTKFTDADLRKRAYTSVEKTPDLEKGDDLKLMGNYRHPTCKLVFIDLIPILSKNYLYYAGVPGLSGSEPISPKQRSAWIEIISDQNLMADLKLIDGKTYSLTIDLDFYD